MLNRGKEKTLRTLTSMLARCKKKEQVLVGANYTSSLLWEDMPIASAVENLRVTSKGKVVQGTIYFRPTDKKHQTALSDFREYNEALFINDFPDPVTEVPLAESTFQQDIMGTGTVISNVQEIPMEMNMKDARVYVQKITIHGVKHTQIQLTHKESAMNFKQTLTLLFMDRHYDGQTLLGYWKNGELNRTESLKLLQLITTGSLVQYVLGGITVRSADMYSRIYPLFKDFVAEFRETEKLGAILNMQCDTGQVTLFDKDIKRVEVTSKVPHKYTITLHTDSVRVGMLYG